MLRPIFHIFVASLEFFTIWYDQKFINIVFVEELKGYPFQNRCLYMTMWSLALQAIYMTISFFNDIIGTNEASPKNPSAIRKIKDLTFSASYTASLYVSIFFWLIYTIDKDLMLPENIRNQYPAWANHVMHTFVSIFIVMEMFICNIDYPKRGSYYVASFLAWSYTFVILTAFYQSGYWPYVVLNQLNGFGQMMFIVASYVTGAIVNYTGIKLNNILSSGSKQKLY